MPGKPKMGRKIAMLLFRPIYKNGLGKLGTRLYHEFPPYELCVKFLFSSISCFGIGQ